MSENDLKKMIKDIHGFADEQIEIAEQSTAVRWLKAKTFRNYQVILALLVVAIWL